MKRLTLFAVLSISLGLINQAQAAIEKQLQYQKEVVCLNGKKASDSSCTTPPLHTLTSVNVDCDANTDGVIGLATSSLECANTGEIVVDGWRQFSISIFYTYSAGTYINMQCDESEDGGSNWATRTIVNVDGDSILRTWSQPVSFSTKIKWNFDINAELIRCRIWATSGGTGDKIIAKVRLGG